VKTLVLPDDHDLCIRTFLGEIESLKPGPRKGALHVGAHVGEEVPAYAAAGYRPIYLVEANPELLPVLNGRFEHDPNVHVIATAIGDTAGSVEFIVHRTRKGSVESASILPLERLGQIVPVFDSSARYTVPVCTIDSLIGSHGIAGRLDLLVLDIQGAELHALRGATEALKAFSFVICEVNLINNYAGGALERDVDAFLEGAGFTKRLAIYHELYDASGRFPAWGECLWHR
jgi:FkbM family methyltransferase